MLDKIEGIVDIKKIDAQVDALKRDVVQHVFIETFETYAKENVFKGQSTALELFVKNRNAYLPTQLREVQLLNNHVENG